MSHVSLTVHHVTEIQRETVWLQNSSTYVHNLLIADADGNTLEVKLFSLDAKLEIDNIDEDALFAPKG